LQSVVDANGESGDVVLGVVVDQGLEEGIADLRGDLVVVAVAEGGRQQLDPVVEAAGAGLDQAVGVQQQQ
jgi:hypothetical protein